MNEKTTNENLDQGFNDDELADIMSEIENLEKEFVEETPIAAEETVIQPESLIMNPEEVAQKKTDLQAEIDSEMESLMKDRDEGKKIEVPEKVKVETVESALNPLEEAIQAIESEKENEKEEDAFLAVAQSTPVAQEVKIEEVKIVNVVEEKMSDNVVEFKPTKSETLETKTTHANQTQLDFSVSGQMNLKFNLTIGEQTIGLHVSEADGLVIEMMGGGRFVLPLNQVSAKKKAA